MSSIDSVLDTAEFSKWIGLQTQSAKEHFNNQVSDWKTDCNLLNSLSTRFRKFKVALKSNSDFYPKCNDIFNEIAVSEKTINGLITDNSELEKESYNEILFLRPVLKPLNFIPSFLFLWSFIRVYLLPGLSFIVPFLTLIAPYIVLKFAFNLPITLQNYMNILQSMMSGKGINTDNYVGFSPVNFIKQFGVVLITFIQGIIQPYWSYKHLKSVDNIIMEKGKAILKFKELYNKLKDTLCNNGFNFFKSPIPDIKGERDAVASVILNPSYYKLALKYIGAIEVIIRLANNSEINPVKWITSAMPVFKIEDTFDYQVAVDSRKKVSIDFSTKHHALLTGPNRGGKSTVLRALSVSALLAHTFGCSHGFATMTPFYKMFVCLKPDDLPGTKSRFEREVEFTANTLNHNNPMLVFIDELFHSTNPPDALRSCQIYCDKLWRKPQIISVISTHLFDLVEQSNSEIQKLCCPAYIDKSGNIVFEYSLKQGICKVSSVDELLRKNKLL